MKYKILYQEEEKIKKLVLEEEEYKNKELPKNIIQVKKLEKKRNFIKQKKLSNAQLYRFFNELDIMLKANISLKDAFSILAKNRSSNIEKQFAKVLLESINDPKAMRTCLKDFKIDPVVESFFQLVNKKGNLQLSLDALRALLEFKLHFKANLFKTLSYPILLLITLFVSLFCIFYFVLPSFESLLMQNALKANGSTLMLFSLKSFLLENFPTLFLIFILFIFVIIVLYKINEEVRLFIDKTLLLHFPIISSLFLSFELYKIFLVLNILQKANYEFHDTLNALDVLVKNKYLLDKIAHIKNLLKSGRSISESFKAIELFDEVVLNLIHTGEVSTKVAYATNEIEKIYQLKFEQRVKLFSFWVQPLVFILIMGLILWIIFAIFMPMWNMSDMIIM